MNGLDVKLGLRLMRKSWGLTLVGGVAMAITIGLGTSIFTLWNTATTTTLPLPDGDRIVAIQAFDAARQRVYRDSSLHDLNRWREHLRSVSDVSAMRRVQRTLATPDGAAGPVSVAEMTPSAFRVAGVQPTLGRALLDQDERIGANVVVIGARVWREGFSSDPAVVGRRLRLDAVDYTVVGVMPETFAFPVSQRIWTPLRTNPLEYPAGQVPDVFVFARLGPGFTEESANAEVAALGGLPPPRAAPADDARRPRVVPYVTGLFGLDAGRSWTGSLVLMLAALLLLPPCANIAILIYARAVTRREEFAMRHALGASRGRIVAQLFVEVLVLAAAAGTVGFVLARQLAFAERLSEAVLPTMGPGNVPFWFDFRPSLSVVLCLAGLVAVAAAIAGAVPGLRVTRRWRHAGLPALGERGTRAGLGRTWTALLAMQLAVAVAVLPMGTQLLWGVVKPALSGPGLDVDRFLTGVLVMDGGDDARVGARQSELVRRLSAEPGISGVTLSADPLMDESGARVELDGGNRRAGGRVAVNRVDAAFFGLFGARFLMGRALDARDFGPGESQAVVVSKTFAAEIAGTENVLGRRVRYVTRQDAAVSPRPERLYEIVGVVEDFPADYDQATVYHPLRPGDRQVTVTVRAASEARLVASRLRDIPKAIDPSMRLARLRSLGEISRQRGSVGSTLGLLVGSVMLIVLLFAIAGMYTLMAFVVAARWREIGVRYALGAPPRRLVAEIFGRSLVPLAIGASLGWPMAVALDSAVQVEDVGGLSIPGVVPATIVAMMLVGALALAGPARRAIRIDPVEALRENQ